MDILTIDQAIIQLEKLRVDIGGGASLVVPGSGGQVRHVFGIGLAAVGKADHSKLVSRGGCPVAAIQLV